MGTEALLQASQALPLLLLLFLSSVTPRATAYLSTTSLAISPLILLLLPRKCKRRGEKAATTRERKREAGDLGEMDEEERAAENVSEKQALWHGDLQGITSCNKVSNCVLLDEYRHNLSAALGHLPGDE